MTEVDRPYVHVIYCDDIRFEIGNKRSYIGVYGPTLYVPQFPAELPKLCIWVNFVAPIETHFEKVVIRVLDEADQLMLEVPIPGDDIEKIRAQMPSKHIRADLQRFGLELHLLLAPLKIDGPKKIRVRVEADGEEYRGARLDILPAPEVSQPQ